jgi:type II secretory pathway pseudopilin PulG
VLVVISIVSALLAITVPALNLARRQARSVIGMRNQREVATALNLFAMDNQDRYPDSVATIGFDDNFSWQDPTK